MLSSNGVQILVLNKIYSQENDYYGPNLIIYQLETDKELPICNNPPEDISIWQNETATIWWELFDESGGGTFRILKNETVMVNWTEWNNSKSIKYFINDTSSPGRTKYTIEFKDNAGNLNKDVVYVFVVKEGWPLSDHPNDIVAYTGDNVYVIWELRDKEYDNSSDPYKYYYRILLNGTIAKDWNVWPKIITPKDHSTILYCVDASEMGTYNYTIQFKDPDGHLGNDTVIVRILERSTIPDSSFFQWKYVYQLILILIFFIQIPIMILIIIYSKNKMNKINVFE
ncbi:MAG: hypothetical protein ACTSPQ_09745 [Candidatus Helarchaeota archaeon]